jgi:hypothetical protein
MNLVTDIGADRHDGRLRRRTPDNDEAAAVIAALDAELGRWCLGLEFHPGVQYRHIMVAPSILARRRVHAAPRHHRSAGRVADGCRRAAVA